MRNLLRRLGQMGKTVIVSSHILPELADICNKVGIINRGILEVNATVAEVMRQVRNRVSNDVLAQPSTWNNILAAMQSVRQAHGW